MQAAARVLTGYRLDFNVNTLYFFDDTLHDETNKIFSSVYNNNVTAGQIGSNGENELDELLNMILTNADKRKQVHKIVIKHD